MDTKTWINILQASSIQVVWNKVSTLLNKLFVQTKFETRWLGNWIVCLKSKHTYVWIPYFILVSLFSPLFCRSRNLGKSELLSYAWGLLNSSVSFTNHNCNEVKSSLGPCVRVLRAEGHCSYATKLELGLKGNQKVSKANSETRHSIKIRCGPQLPAAMQLVPY